MTTVATISPHLTGIDAPSALRDLQGACAEPFGIC